MIGLAPATISKQLRQLLRLDFPEIISSRSQQVMSNGVWVALFVHSAFFVLFYYLGASSLVSLNIVSVLLYTGCVILARDKRNSGLVLGLFAIEIIVHAAVAVSAFGWSSGFHYYLMILIPFIFANENGSYCLKIFIASALCAFYMLLHHMAEISLPTVYATNEMLRSMQYGNIFGAFASMAYLAHLHRLQVLEVEDELRQMATTDSLTGLFNRRHLLQMYDLEMVRRSRKKSAMTMVVMDIDNFKCINDEHGHDVGDAVLVQIANTLASTIRQQDLLGRWGGEEFLLILPDTDAQGGAKIAESIRHQISCLLIKHEQAMLNITVSVGVSEMALQEKFDDCFVRADQALFRAKAAGKNQVMQSP
jgi:diguanylate cyclase (GGDEF)-like protein